MYVGRQNFALEVTEGGAREVVSESIGGGGKGGEGKRV